VDIGWNGVKRELIVGYMAVVTSKLVSMKQEKMLEQIYHLSFSEKLNRILSGLALFKGESDKIVADLSENEIVDRKTLFSIKMSFASLKNNMNEIKKEFVDKKHFFSKLENPQIEQVLSGMSQVYKEISSIVILLEKNDVSFKNPIVLEEIYSITNIGVQILTKIRSEFPIFTDKISCVFMRYTIICFHMCNCSNAN